MFDDTTQPAQAQPYTAPALHDLGTIRAVTLGSSENDTADKKKYYN
ncbi:lasso RiPP family leader peptide-containing protein [Nonomuraea sp. NPDC049646]